MLWTVHHTRSHAGTVSLTDVVLGSTREWPPVSRLWRPVSQCPSLSPSAAEGSHGAGTDSSLLWVGFPALLICRILWVLGAIFLPPDLISPAACFALTAGQNLLWLLAAPSALAVAVGGEGLPPSQGPGDGPICSLILRKAVLQI